MKAIAARGCHLPPEAIRCVSCTAREVGGGFSVFSKEAPRVELCAQELPSSERLRETLAHELVHAYDYCANELSFHNLFHHACSEIRAGNLSGDCDPRAELSRGNLGFFNHHDTCVRRRAVRSVAMNPNCASKAQAEEAVAKAFSICIRDVAPFEKRP